MEDMAKVNRSCLGDHRLPLSMAALDEKLKVLLHKITQSVAAEVGKLAKKMKTSYNKKIKKTGIRGKISTCKVLLN